MSSHSNSEPGQSVVELSATTRPAEEECWEEFWTKLAAAWASLPADVQRECMEQYPDPVSAKSA